MTVSGRGDWDRWWGKVDTLDEVNLLDGFGGLNGVGVVMMLARWCWERTRVVEEENQVQVAVLTSLLQKADTSPVVVTHGWFGTSGLGSQTC